MDEIIIDVTELVGNPIRTGIQRVVRKLLRHWPSEGPRFHVARFDGADLVALPHEALQLLNEQEPATARLSRDQLAQRLNTAVAALPPEPLPALPVLVPEIFFDQSRADFHYNRARETGLPLMMLAYDFLPWLNPDLFCLASRGHLMWYIRTLHAAASVAHISEDTRQAFQKRIARGSGANGPVLPLGADALTLERQQWRPDRKNYVALGSLDGRKNQHLIVGAFRRLWEEGYDMPLVLIGKTFTNVADDWVRDALRYPRFRWLPDATDAEIADELRHARATIYVSTNEGYGLPPVESLACGVPVIAFAGIPSLAMFPPDGQLRLHSVTEDHLVEALLQCEHDGFVEQLWSGTTRQCPPTWDHFGHSAAAWIGALRAEN